MASMKIFRLHHKGNTGGEEFQYHGQTATLKNTNTNNLTYKNEKPVQIKDRKKNIVSVQRMGKLIAASFL
ncbi:hypothetical protein TNCV_4499021 [Trichonephila clavipes]|nr:hypothetical protein TNCV_4499021 [Trichonephila clavipes]